ncbi:hypothetical protein [Mesorhizobium amorphae]|uniref:hypothetical protein n=1 Tax=Mesorhizobium amorphae TaxID=71433 RepID=UPI00177B210B|nr:hypothetical protein [Mesorhizobium amorphae]
MKYDHIFDALSIAVLRPRLSWRGVVSAFAIDLGGKFAAGIVFGLGVAVGFALAG